MSNDKKEHASPLSDNGATITTDLPSTAAGNHGSAAAVTLSGIPLPKLSFSQQSENATFHLSRSPVDLAAEASGGGDDILRGARQSGWVTRDI